MGNYLQFALGKVFGTKNERELKRLSERVVEINALEPEMQKLADAEFPLRTQQAQGTPGAAGPRSTRFCRKPLPFAAKQGAAR